MDIKEYMQQIGRAARQASRVMAAVGTAQKNAALLAIADEIEQSTDQLLTANQKDMTAAMHAGLDKVLLDRLSLNKQGVAQMAEGLRQVAALTDPVGEMSDFSFRPSGIQVGKMRVPLGVVGIIYEARPNVTADAAALCIKSGNATILRGGSEALHSNQAIAMCLYKGLKQAALPQAAVQVIDTTDRSAVGELIRLTGLVDVIVPRGGQGLIARISDEARIPVIKHLHGNCHVYIDANANADNAISIVLNAKTNRYGTCNTLETLLVHEACSTSLLARLAKELQAKNVELRGCTRTQNLLGSSVIPAVEDDWYTEYLAPILAIKIVDTLADAIEHINHYGSHHTDAIVTEDYRHARRFLRDVDSASVLVNASTRFADGFEYGLGAEIGISTDKIHARGPVGLKGLTSEKWIVLGDGHIRE